MIPQGVISFFQRDGVVMHHHRGFLHHVLSGDTILADRGFLIEESLVAFGESLCIPAFTNDKINLLQMKSKRQETSQT